MLEIVIGIIAIFHFIFWVYSLYAIIAAYFLSSVAKLGFVLLILFLQPFGLLSFWIYKLAFIEKKFSKLNPVD